MSIDPNKLKFIKSQADFGASVSAQSVQLLLTEIDELRAVLAQEADADKVNNRQMGMLQFVEKHGVGHVEEPLGMVEPVAYRYKEGHASWENEKPWEPTTLAHGAVLLERKALAANGAFKGDSQAYYLALTVEPLYTSPPAPVAVMLSFDFEHPFSKERRTVTLTKQEVYDGMEDYFYEKLGEQICQCESVGETNVVDCNCDEYVHDFDLVADNACLDKVKEMNQ